MSGWNKVDGLWGEEPKRKKQFPAEENTGETQHNNLQGGYGERRDPPASPDTMICPWCGRKMTSGTLSATKTVWWAPGSPEVKKSSLDGSSRSSLQLMEDGSVFSLSRCRKTVWHCLNCQKLVIDTEGLRQTDREENSYLET